MTLYLPYIEVIGNFSFNPCFAGSIEMTVRSENSMLNAEVVSILVLLDLSR